MKLGVLYLGKSGWIFVRGISKDKAGIAVNLDKDLGEIIGRLPETFPRHLSIEEQGRFAIGYYQQKQSYFAPKQPAETDETQGE